MWLSLASEFRLRLASLKDMVGRREFVMSRLYRVVLILALTLISVSAEAQTSDELKHKYESSGESSYLVRPDIILTVTFDENG